MNDQDANSADEKIKKYGIEVHSGISKSLIVNQLVDMDWKFGVTASSSELNKVGSTFLQLKLVINKGNKLENVFMELTLPQFYAFLHEMEKAKASLEYFT